MKKVLSLILSIIMLFNITAGLDLSAYAGSFSGKCGNNVSYTLNTDTGVLTITGTGDMNNYAFQGTPWYSNIDYIKTVKISQGVTSIGEGAFENCSNLICITIPDGITNIGSYAFNNCLNLDDFNMPTTVKYIGDSAFIACNELGAISISKNIISIGKDAFSRDNSGSIKYSDMAIYFQGTHEEWNKKSISNIGSEEIRFLSGDYYYSVENNTCVTIKKYYGSDKNLSIPSKIEGLKVTTIGEYAIYTDETFDSVTIPGDISRIYYDSFRYNDFLKYGDAVPIKKIFGCSESAAEDFANSNNIPFSSIGVSNDKFGYTVKEDNSIRIFDYYGTAENLTIPSVIDGYTVTEIGYKTFETNNSFKTIYIPESITKIESLPVFDVCTNLESIIVSESNIKYASENGVLFNHDKTELLYYPCGKNDSAYFIPNSVTTIGVSAFYKNAKLNKVVIPNSVENISSTAFQDCTGIETLVIGENAVIGDETFKGCNKIEYLTVGNDNQIKTLKGKRINEILNIKELNIGSSVSNIDVTYYNNDFKNLLNINVDHNNKNYASMDGVLFDKSINQLLVYPRGKTAVSYTVPSTVTKICNFAFEYAQLNTISLPSSLLHIGRKAFSVSKLVEIEIPSNVISIGDLSFAGCNELKKIDLGNLTSIGYRAFDMCSMLTEVYIPSTLTQQYSDDDCTIMAFADVFDDCTGINKITVDEQNPVFLSCDNVVFNKDKTILYFYPKGASLEQYQVPEGVDAVWNSSFSSCPNLKSITVPHSVQMITDDAFNGTSISTIYGYSGAYAETYATAKNIEFIPLQTSEISILSFPDKMVYLLNDSFDANGLAINIKMNDGTNKTITNGFTVSTPNMSTAGTKTVTVTYQGKTTSFVITVKTPSISLSASSKTMTVGDTVALSATITPSGQSVNWSSSNTSVATVSNGVVTAKASGATVITGKFTYNGKIYSSTCTISVECKHSYSSKITSPATCTSSGIRTYTCTICGDSYNETITATGHSFSSDSQYCKNRCGTVNPNYKETHIHSWNSGVITKTASCSTTGIKVYTCTTCGETKNETIPIAEHSYITAIAKPTCTENGYTKYLCVNCGYTCNANYVFATGHTYKTTTIKATTKRNGSVVTKCTICGKVTSKSTIHYPKTIRLSETSYIYNGKAKKPSVTVKGSNGKTISSKYYTVTYAKGRRNVGKYTVTIKFKGKYSGTVKKTFTIMPKATSISKLTPGKKKFTVKWKKQATQTTGYQIQYSTSSKFKSPKTVTVSKNSTTSKTIAKLKAKKKYYVRIRTYKTVNGKKIYSSWSKSKSVTTKK